LLRPAAGPRCLLPVRLATSNPVRVLEFDRMHPAIPRLIDLQAVDHHVAAVRAEMDSFPKRILEADHKLSGARAAVAAAKEATATSVAERKKLEFEVQQWKDRARKYRDQSGAVKTNEAYKALQHEITNAEAEVAKAEDRQLEVMMASEEAERRVRNAEANLREDEQAINAEKKRIQSLNTEKKKELDAALAERERVIAPVPQDMRDLYERIAKRHHGTALALARDEQCRGCGMRVLPHILQMLRDDANEEVYRCESCGLILYSLEPIPAPNPEGSGSAASASTSS
jgi:predicted  nucleic acid-binding Zn-ribbon protein